MFGEVADLAAIPVDNLVVTFEGNRVFPSSNPHGMNIWAEAELGKLRPCMHATSPRS